MRLTKYIHTFAGVLTSGLLLVSCNQEGPYPSTQPQELRFETFIEQGGEIRPVAVSRSLTANPLSNGYRLCGLLSTADYPASTAYDQLMWSVAMNADGSYKSTATKYFWAEGNAATRHTFVAYSDVPTGSTGTSIATPTGGTSAQPTPTVVYTHANDPAQQMDLLYSDNAKNMTLAQGAPLVRLVFKHRLTRLVFKMIGTGGVTLAKCQGKISYKANTVRNGATLGLSATGSTTLSSTYHSGTYNLGSEITLPNGAVSLATAVEVGDMILIPQNLTEGWGTVSLTYTPDGGVSPQTITVELPALSLSNAMGEQYDILLNVVEESSSLSITGVTLVPWNEKSGDIDPDLIRPINSPTPSQYVKIDNLYWAIGNLVADGSSTGCKVGAPTDYGLYFHFGSLVGWSGGSNGGGTGQGSPSMSQRVKPTKYTGKTSWPAGYYTGGSASTGYGLPVTDNVLTGIGDPCRYYLGGTWRTPTAAEFKALDAAGRGSWTTNGGVNGRWLGTSPESASSSVFVPASGYRDTSSGAFTNVATYGYSWSSSVSSATNGSNLYIYSSGGNPQSYAYRSYGFPVRCVSEAP